MAKSTETVSIPLEPGWDEIREGVRRICEQYPNAYWMKLDHESAYPFEFVNALTEAGYLGALIPEEYGGAGLPISAGCAILETILDIWPAERLGIADRGIREGILRRLIGGAPL
jgi:alkylation response protein AidB-like acyl-CoA dehydrogenase